MKSDSDSKREAQIETNEKTVEELQLELELLRIEETTYRDIFARSPAGYFRTSLAGDLIMANPSVIKTLGYESIEPVQKKGLTNLYADPNRRNELLAVLKKEGKVDEFDVSLLHSSGEPIHFLLYGALLNNNDGVPEFLEGHLLNITEIRSKENELRERLEVIDRQRIAIARLSTPILQIWDGVVALPLIGMIDANRAADIMERLLDEVSKLQSRYVILDLTGVELIDTNSANHLIMVVKAVKLLGAQCVVTGIRSAVSQTLVDLGVELESIKTLGNLKEGLKECLRQLSSK